MNYLAENILLLALAELVLAIFTLVSKFFWMGTINFILSIALAVLCSAYQESEARRREI